MSPDWAAGLTKQAVGKFNHLAVTVTCTGHLQAAVPSCPLLHKQRGRWQDPSSQTLLGCSGAPARDVPEVCMQELLGAVHSPRESSNAEAGRLGSGCV